MSKFEFDRESLVLRVEQAPDDWRARLNLAKAYLERGRDREALGELHEVLRLSDNRPEVSAPAYFLEGKLFERNGYRPAMVANWYRNSAREYLSLGQQDMAHEAIRLAEVQEDGAAGSPAMPDPAFVQSAVENIWLLLGEGNLEAARDYLGRLPPANVPDRFALRGELIVRLVESGLVELARAEVELLDIAAAVSRLSDERRAALGAALHRLASEHER